MSVLEVTLVCVLSAVAACGLAVFLFKKDTEKEGRRRGAAKLAGVLSALGLVKIPDFLVDYSVGDYSGMTKKIAELAKLFLDGSDAVLKEFEVVFERLLDARLASEAGRALIAAKLEDAVRAKDVTAVVTAPKAGVV